MGKNEVDKLVYGYSTDVNGLEEENRFLKETIENLESELQRFKKAPLIACEVKEVYPDNKVMMRLMNGNEFFVEVSKECEELRAGDSALAEQKHLTIVKKINNSKKFDVEKFVIMETPNVSWNDVGGLKDQEREIKEVIELPLTNPKIFQKIGIDPPKGILLHGPSGTGKTLLAKAVASSTNSTFIEVVGSELVQKFIGEGAKLVKEIFDLAREKAPSIIFIDELDAIAATRVDIGTSGEREVQRTFMQLLAEIDGFNPLGNVKVIGCTNRKDILDNAIIRPGRLDRLIEVPLPSQTAVRDIFRIHTSRMNLCKINEDGIIEKMKGLSGAEIKAIATEAGYFAIRDNRTKVKEEDFMQAVEKIKKDEEDGQYARMFG